MALRLRQAIAGRPNVKTKQSVGVLAVDGRGFIVYPSSSNVILLTPELQLSETLQFWSALPHRATSSTPGNVQGVSCSSSESLIIAWSDVHVVLWQYLPSRSRGNWNVHSTVVASSPITCLDFLAGTLVLGTQQGIEYWRMDPKAEVVVWDRLWERSYPPPTSIHISPATGHLAWIGEEQQKSAYIIIVDRKGQATGRAQEIRNPREIAWIGWRQAKPGSGDAHLYTITTNSVLRLYSPVLDDPAWFQLHLTLDHSAFASQASATPKSKGEHPESNPFGVMWVWNTDVLRSALGVELEGIKMGRIDISAEGRQKLDSLEAEESDIVAWVGPDGIVVLRSIMNIERKPPTLLKSLYLGRTSCPSSVPPDLWTSRAQLLLIPETTLSVVLPPTDRHPYIGSLQTSLTNIICSEPQGFSTALPDTSAEETTLVQLEHAVERLVRTPNGRGLLAIGEGGEIAMWYKQQLGVRPNDWDHGPKALVGKGHWRDKSTPSQAAVFAKGRAIVFYTKPEDGSGSITLQHLDAGATTPQEPLTLPHFTPTEDDEVEMLLAVSDIDDGFSGKGRRTQRAIVMAATRGGEAWVWRVVSRITPSNSEIDGRPDVFLLSHYRLPLDSGHQNETPRMILPVDPMGWHQSTIDWTTDTPLQDMILTVSNDGDLEFWTPKIGQHLASATEELKGLDLKHGDMACEMNGHAHQHRPVDEPWTRTGVVRTERRNLINARCSSRKKTVLICELPDGRHEMTIWDSNVSEFSTGLELTHIFAPGETILDLDWTTTSDLQSVLAIGFAHRVLLICEQRMSYVETTPRWAPLLTIDMQRYTSVPISDSIWLAGGSLAVGAGNQIYLFSRFLGRDTPTPSPSASARSVRVDEEEPEDIFQLIAHQNGPLVDYHPILLAQCLLWDKGALVKSILLQLVKALRNCEEAGKKRLVFNRLDPSEFYSTRKTIKAAKSSDRKYDGLFDTVQPEIEDDDDEFTARVVADLIERLHGNVRIPLSQAEKSFLVSVAQATHEAEQQRRALDFSGLRYLISLRMYVNWDRIRGANDTLAPDTGGDYEARPNGTGAEKRGRSHFSFRNIVWATHSESQELLLAASTESCRNGKMLWDEAKRLGIFLWLKSAESVKAQIEIIARNRFMVDEDRDPTSCSLIFFALGKKKVVHGLWRQAPGHKEQQLMLKFLANDFELDRWKTAAMKNAYALLSKQRYEYAAAFFMLAGRPKDAITVCLRQLDDWQLGLALARVVEGGTEGPIVKWILNDTVLPMAFKGGHRWLATWAFWTLGRRDLAVRVLISPINDVAEAFLPDTPLEVGNPENDDPSLLLMFQHLKSKSLQTAKGTSEVSTKLEFDFVLHNARVFFRMGCHNLALDLIRSWSFERPFFPPQKLKSRKVATPISTPTPVPLDGAVPTRPSLAGSLSQSYTGHRRRQSFMLTSGRRESLIMDMDVLAESGASSRVPTPPNEEEQPINGDKHEEALRETEEVNEDGTDKGSAPVEDKQEKARPATPPKKIGNLMKELKQDVQQGAMEFNMDNFF
ncbi:hypothetical protein IAR55_006128 [Kwoniella newhampshirensis]|uniref:RAVE complex protein Rav1 C-terminal domain-containing protein n=1 Tax=Kwoniella newhampshirensis TaxID=1651941 RepID=A0AAW0YFB3_9TREE